MSPSVRGSAGPLSRAEQSRLPFGDFPSQELFSLVLCLKALWSHSPLKSVLSASFRFEWCLARTDTTPVNRWKREGGEVAPAQKASAWPSTPRRNCLPTRWEFMAPADSGVVFPQHKGRLPGWALVSPCQQFCPKNFNSTCSRQQFPHTISLPVTWSDRSCFHRLGAGH